MLFKLSAFSRAFLFVGVLQLLNDCLPAPILPGRQVILLSVPTGEQHLSRGELPDHVDFRETGLLPPVLNQGQLGSCVSNAGAAISHLTLALPLFLCHSLSQHKVGLSSVLCLIFVSHNFC